jgi:hypothetical protein
MIYHIVIIIDKTTFLQNSHPQKNTITVVVQHTLQLRETAIHLISECHRYDPYLIQGTCHHGDLSYLRHFHSFVSLLTTGMNSGVIRSAIREADF